jgi:hypothetical protein
LAAFVVAAARGRLSNLGRVPATTAGMEESRDRRGLFKPGAAKPEQRSTAVGIVELAAGLICDLVPHGCAEVRLSMAAVGCGVSNAGTWEPRWPISRIPL